MKGVGAWIRSVRVALRSSLGRDRNPDFPWVAASLALGVLVAAIGTGVFVHELSPTLAGRGAFGWPALRAGRWWTLATSFFLTRNWFMAATMPVCLFLSISLYERRAGHVRAFSVAAVGHVSGSVLVGLGAGALGWSGEPILVRAAQNMDYGGSMAIAAVLGALASRLNDRRVRWLVFGIAVLALPAHHQMADWGHIVAVPTGYLIDRVRTPRPSLALFTGFTAVTVALAAFGPAVIDATADTIRFGDPGAAFTQPSEPSGRLVTFSYEATLLEHRPETVEVYLPPGPVARRPVLVFLHDLPGSPNDWVAGAAVDQLLGRRMSAHAFPRALAVFAALDGYRDPSAGWLDARAQPTLTSLVRDLLPSLARRFPNQVDVSSIAAVGVGRGANGALAFGRVDRRARWVVALDPVGNQRATSPTTRLLLERSPAPGWRHWSSELPAVLDWLASSGFGAHAATKAAK